MFKLSLTCKRIILFNLIISAILFGIGIFFIDDIAYFAKGVVFGTAFSILKMILLEKTIKKAIDMTEANAQNYTRLHYSLRYILTGVVIFIGAISRNTSFLIGILCGIAALTPAVMIAGKLEKKIQI